MFQSPLSIFHMQLKLGKLLSGRQDAVRGLVLIAELAYVMETTARGLSLAQPGLTFSPRSSEGQGGFSQELKEKVT